MRAPVQMKRPRGKGDKAAARPLDTEGATSEARADTPESATGLRPQPDTTTDAAPAGRRKRVRNRLVAAVAVVAAAVAGAGAPGITASSGQLAESQELVTLAELTKSAVTLAHALADERDEVTAHIAAGRPDDPAAREALTDGRGSVDRRIKEVRAEAPAALRRDLDALGKVRRSATEGRGTALEAHVAYTKAIGELHALVEDLAAQLPPRAGSGARALAELDRAVEQAGATRGLLLAALATPRDPATGVDPVTGQPQAGASTNSRNRNALVAAAQQARVSEQAALADFERAAPDTDRAKLGSTVTGPEVAAAERYLARLTDQPTLSAAELRYDRERVAAALSARVEQLRSVENTLSADRVESLSSLRDDDVTALEVRIALIGVLLLLAVGIATAIARTLTRPLAVLRLGSARLAETPATDEPIRFTGRNDEFAAVVRSVNSLHAHTRRLQDRLTYLEGDRKHLVGQREKLADEREELREQLDEALAQAERTQRHGADGTVVQLALRHLALVERQLGVIENLEEREQDPERLDTLFKLDHFATVMRRHSENLLVLAGAEHRDSHPGPVPLIDVLRAAVSEIDAYDRVRIASLPPHAHLAGATADDISHLVAELLENATTFSPPDAAVEASAWLLESGDVMLSVRDEGIGLPEDRLRRLNDKLAEFDPSQPYVPASVSAEAEGTGELGLGLYVVARLAALHGLSVELREQKQGGLAALVVLPASILAAAPAEATPQHPVAMAAALPQVHLPGAEAEANANVLDRRSPEEDEDPGQAPDPFIRAAERAFDETPESSDTEAAGTDEKATHTSTPTPATAEQSGDPEPFADAPLPGQTPGADAALAAEERVGDTDSDAAPAFGTESPGGATFDADPGFGGESLGDAEPAPEPELFADAASVSGSTPTVADAESTVDPVLDSERTGDAESAADAEPVSGLTSGAEAAAGADAAPVFGAESITAPVPADDAESTPDIERADDARPTGDTTPATTAPEPHPEHAHEPEPDPEADTEFGRTAGLGADGEPGSVLLDPLSPEAEVERELFGGEGEADAVVADAPEPLAAPAGESVLLPEVGEGHERVADAEVVPQQARRELREPLPQRERTTETGLPVRTPKATGPAPEPVARRSSVDPEALRRRLGSFHRGANSGRRDAEAELAERTGEFAADEFAAGADAATGEAPDRAPRTDQGDPAEEARS
ncbi:nitrate- and nitrite sensing domain-containing protein [Streptomyces sp. Da 82-17]|uniref:nitrate- and nitrite sensing domain-containing protein n=1 Tax=Streptomyces sp. Da 82-17 TaxID=3377116 RepID=UPI0038D4EFA0